MRVGCVIQLTTRPLSGPFLQPSPYMAVLLSHTHTKKKNIFFLLLPTSSRCATPLERQKGRNKNPIGSEGISLKVYRRGAAEPPESPFAGFAGVPHMRTTRLVSHEDLERKASQRNKESGEGRAPLSLAEVCSWSTIYALVLR